MTDTHMKSALLTYRRQDGTINVAAFVTDDLWHVLGKFYCQSSSCTSYKAVEWSRAVTKLVHWLEVAIHLNVFTDAIHLQKVDRHLRLIKEAVQAGPMAEPQAIAELIFLAFELIGGMPHNTDVKHANREAYYHLNAIRSVRYLQTPSQKARLIVDTANWEIFKNHYLAQEIENRYHSAKTPEAFLAWYRTKYPKAYAMIF